MYFTDDSLLPENQAPLMITAAPYGPIWMPVDCTPEQKLPVTWDEQIQAAVDCFNAGATVLHIHVRDPEDRPHLEKFQGVQRPDRTPAQGRAEDDPATGRVNLFCAGAG